MIRTRLNSYSHWNFRYTSLHTGVWYMYLDELGKDSEDWTTIHMPDLRTLVLQVLCWVSPSTVYHLDLNHHSSVPTYILMTSCRLEHVIYSLNPGARKGRENNLYWKHHFMQKLRMEVVRADPWADPWADSEVWPKLAPVILSFSSSPQLFSHSSVYQGRVVADRLLYKINRMSDTYTTWIFSRSVCISILNVSRT